MFSSEPEPEPELCSGNRNGVGPKGLPEAVEHGSN